MNKFITVLLLTIFPLQVYAAVRTWTGLGADNNWTTPANWGGAAPVAGDALVFTGLTRTAPVNDFPAGTAFLSIKLTGIFGAASNFSLSGNSIVLTGGSTAIVNDSGTEGVGGYALNIANNITFGVSPASIVLANTTANSIYFSGTLNNGAMLLTVDNIGNNTNVNINSVISGTGGLLKNGTGTLMLQGANTYSGSTTLNNGVIRLLNSQSLGLGGQVVINGGSFDTFGSNVTLTDHPMVWNANFGLNGNRNVNLGNGAVTMTTDITIFVAANQFLTVGGPISGNYSVTKTGGGTLHFGGNNTYGKTTTISAGTLRLGSAAALGDPASGTVVAAGAVLDLNGQNYTALEPLTINTTATGAIINSNAAAGTYNGIITLASNSYINATVGNISLTNNGNLTGTFNLDLGGVASTNSSISNILDINTGIVTKLGAGTWTLVRNNPYTGATNIIDGKLVLQGNQRSPSYSIAAGATLDLNRLTSVSYTSAVTFSGAGTLMKTGAGAIDWGTNTVNFNLTSGSLIDVQAGTFNAGGYYSKQWAANKSDLNVAAGAVFNCVESNVMVDAVTGGGTILSGWSASGSITFGVDNGSGVFAGIFADNTANADDVCKIIKLGTGTQTLSGSSTYTGTTLISAGILRLGNSNVIPDMSDVTINGTLDLNTKSETLGSITGSGTVDNISGGGSPIFRFGVNNKTTNFAGVIKNTTGSVNVTKAGTGTIFIDGHCTYYGQTYIENGFMEIRNGSITSN